MATIKDFLEGRCIVRVDDKVTKEEKKFFSETAFPSNHKKGLVYAYYSVTTNGTEKWLMGVGENEVDINPLKNYLNIVNMSELLKYPLFEVEVGDVVEASNDLNEWVDGKYVGYIDGLTNCFEVWNHGWNVANRFRYIRPTKKMSGYEGL